MANRQQRRHPAKVTQLPVPSMLQRLKEPEFAADMTVLEVNEITARNKELEYVAAEIATLGGQQHHFARLQAILTNEKRSFIRDLCTNKGLSAQDAFDCDLEKGVIMRVAAEVPIQLPEPIADEPQPEAAEATDAPFVDPDKPS